jgi:hypothetical protein
MTTLMNHPPFAGVDVGGPRCAGETRRSLTDVEILAGGEDIWARGTSFISPFSAWPEIST